MKISIIFHSASGNTYLMAKAFYESLRKLKQDASLYRVQDVDWQEPANISAESKKILSEMNMARLATPEAMAQSDVVIIGSPTYFGNVSGEMKTFMDTTAGFWVEGKFIGKKLVAFTSVAHSEGGGDLCLQAIHTYGQHMGMVSVSIPNNLVQGISCPAYGIIQYSNAKCAEKLDSRVSRVIERFCELLAQ